MEFIPDVPLICTQKGKEGLFKHYFKNWNFQVVKTGDEISLGKRTLKFIETPMLHWPDSMFTYIESDELLLSNDAFGQHIASSFRFADELEEAALMEEAVKYYANILMPFGALVLRKIDEIVKSGIKIKTIAPSHGAIWRNNPDKIINAYLDWAKGETNNKIVIIYDTMWESTKKMAEAMAEGIINQGLETKLYHLSVSDRSDVITELHNAKGVLVGSPTLNRGIFPAMASFLEDIEGLKPKGKIGAAFGSYGWGGGAVEKIKDSLKKAGVEVIDEDLSFKYVPDSEEIKKCFEFGERFAIKIKQAG
jgi:flavorubredoxin